MNNYICFQEFGHDANIALYFNNQLLHLEAERFSKIKNDDNISNIKLNMDLTNFKQIYITHRTNVSYYGLNNINFNFHDNIIKTRNRYHLEHHTAHAAYAYYTKPRNMNKCDILVHDGWGLITDRVFFDENLNRIDDTISGIGLLYSSIAKLIFDNTHHAGKVMGLSAYGKFDNEITNLYHTHLNQYINLNQHKNNINLLFEEKARIGGRRSIIANFYDNNNKPDADYAYAVQKMFEQSTLNYLKKFKTSNNLCIAGGLGLNGYLNKKIIDEGIYEKVYVPPACGDSGLALGGVLWLLNKLESKNINDDFIAYLGNNYNVNDKIIEDIINEL